MVEHYIADRGPDIVLVLAIAGAALCIAQAAVLCSATSGRLAIRRYWVPTVLLWIAWVLVR